MRRGDDLHGAVSGRTFARMKSIDLPPVWLAAAIALAWAQQRVLPALTWTDGTWTEPAGTALISLGFLLMALALAEMVRRRTTPVPHRDPSALATGGVYRASRNPIYLGDILILAGVILRWEAALALILLPLLVILLERRFIRPEEERLRRAFGTDFDAYARRVRRWV
jgi:protein-S-isoprenylcysteine O-methyltransferase Ste14